jgi:PAS domain S-box-containing protein
MNSMKKYEEKEQFISCLEAIAEYLPGNFYWKDRNGVYLGCNKSVLFGCGYEEVVGKTDYDLWPSQAEKLRANDTKVMISGIPMYFEEFIQCSNTILYFTVVKIPLRNSNGDIMGIIGNSLDITDSKKSEKLKIENESHKATIKEQKKFQKLVDQVVHDIRTPLQVLSSILTYQARSLPEKEHIMLRNSIESIRKIAQVLLEYSSEREESLDFQYILVSQTLNEIVEQKEIQYSGNNNVKFQYSFDPSDQFDFIYGSMNNFERMMSNLINNSVEAFEGKEGIVRINFSSEKDKDGKKVKIVVQDNGKGMPQEMVEKLMRNESVSTTKKGGFGIGTGQILGTLKEFNGEQFIESTPNVGTQITLFIPKSGEPKWVLKEIKLCRGDRVVILDDDVLIHQVWKEKLEQYLSDITLEFFEKGKETVDFIKSFEEKDRLVLLSDNELRNQELDGLDVIQNSGISSQRSILVSGIYNRKEVQDRGDSLGVKILPKAFIESVQIIFEGESLLPSAANIVVLDDEKYFADHIGDILRSKGMEVDVYCDPRDFMKNLLRYDPNTKVIVDNYFQGGMSGEVLAKELFEKGFENICLLSGVVDTRETLLRYPVGTCIISKGSDNCVEKLLLWCKNQPIPPPSE